VAGCCKCGDEPSGSGAMELVICRYSYDSINEQRTGSSPFN
jgi:hypothetical protein